jgi:hypothetical protein
MRRTIFQVNSGTAEPIRVNLRTVVNNADIRTVTEDGREYLVIPSYTLPDGVVMNGGLYLKEEIDKSYLSLEDTPAPVGHPMANGKFISAYHPKATNAYYAGAFNRNVRREGNRVYLEKWVDTEFAKNSLRGQELLEAVNLKKPIHTSTGILLEQEPVTNADGYKWIARNMRFDHDAILINETGAATPDQGVGLMVNVSDAIPAPDDAPEPEEQTLVNKILTLLRGGVVSKPETVLPNTEALDMNPEELKAALDAQLQALTAANAAALEPITAQIAELKAANTALTEQLTANTQSHEAEMRAAVAEHVGGEVVANALSGDALRAAFAKFVPAAPLIGGLPVANKQDGFDELPD